MGVNIASLQSHWLPNNWRVDHRATDESDHRTSFAGIASRKGGFCSNTFISREGVYVISGYVLLQIPIMTMIITTVICGIKA